MNVAASQTIQALFSTESPEELKSLEIDFSQLEQYPAIIQKASEN